MKTLLTIFLAAVLFSTSIAQQTDPDKRAKKEKRMEKKRLRQEVRGHAVQDRLNVKVEKQRRRQDRLSNDKENIKAENRTIKHDKKKVKKDKEAHKIN